MKAKEIIKRLKEAGKGQFTNVKMLANLNSSLTAASRKNGIKLFRESVVQIQARIPYTSIAEVKEAMERGDRDAPRLPFAASSVHSVIDGIILYNPKNMDKGLLAGIRPINTLSAKFVDENGQEISKEKAQEYLVPSYFKKQKSKSEHKEGGTGEWRTPYLTTIQDIGFEFQSEKTKEKVK